MKISRSDITVVLISIAILLISAFFLYREIFYRGDVSGSKIIGDLSFQFGTVKRKPTSGVLWEYLGRGDEIYNNDSIHTGDSSESIIELKNGIKIEMDDNSMIVVYTEDIDNYDLNINDGSFLVKSTGNSTGSVNVIYENNKIGISKGEFRFAKKNTGLYVTTMKGVANITYAGGKTADIDEGKTTVISEKGADDSLVYIKLFPPDNMHYFPREDTQDVTFKWDLKKALIEISHNRNFTNPVVYQEVDSSKISIRLASGIYYWRIRTEDNKYSQFQKIHIVPEEKTNVTSPIHESAYLTTQKNTLVDFSWLNNSLAEYYRLELSENEHFSNIIYDKKIYRNGIVIELPLGTYYWRLSTIRNNTVVSMTSVMLFSVEEGEEALAPMEEVTGDSSAQLESGGDAEVFSKPDFIFPSMNATVDMSKREKLKFSWRPVKNATQYYIHIYHTEENPENILTEARVSGTEFTLEDLSILDTGNFVCRVEAQNGEELLAESRVTFRIALNQNLKAPDSISKKKKK